MSRHEGLLSANLENTTIARIGAYRQPVIKLEKCGLIFFTMTALFFCSDRLPNDFVFFDLICGQIARWFGLMKFRRITATDV